MEENHEGRPVRVVGMVTAHQPRGRVQMRTPDSEPAAGSARDLADVGFAHFHAPFVLGVVSPASDRLSDRRRTHFLIRAQEQP
jgi:hypothetical protein